MRVLKLSPTRENVETNSKPGKPLPLCNGVRKLSAVKLAMFIIKCFFFSVTLVFRNTRTEKVF